MITNAVLGGRAAPLHHEEWRIGHAAVAPVAATLMLHLIGRSGGQHTVPRRRARRTAASGPTRPPRVTPAESAPRTRRGARATRSGTAQSSPRRERRRAGPPRASGTHKCTRVQIGIKTLFNLNLYYYNCTP